MSIGVTQAATLGHYGFHIVAACFRGALQFWVLFLHEYSLQPLWCTFLDSGERFCPFHPSILSFSFKPSYTFSLVTFFTFFESSLGEESWFFSVPSLGL